MSNYETDHDHDHTLETTRDDDHELPEDPMAVITVGGTEYPVWRDMPYQRYLEVRMALNEEEDKLRDFIFDNRVSLPETSTDETLWSDAPSSEHDS